jgi:hypothetical protein
LSLTRRVVPNCPLPSTLPKSNLQKHNNINTYGFYSATLYAGTGAAMRHGRVDVRQAGPLHSCCLAQFWCGRLLNAGIGSYSIQLTES